MRSFLKYTPGVWQAVVGLACALMVLEIQRMPAARFVSFSMFAPVPYVVEVVVLVAVAAWYMLRPAARTSGCAALRVSVAVVAMASAWGVLYGPGVGFGNEVLLVVQMAYRVSSGLLFVLWGERLMALGARRAALAFATACLLSGVVTLVFALLGSGAVRVALGLLPVVAGALFVGYRPVVCAVPAEAGTRDVREAGDAQGAGAQARARAPFEFDKPLTRFACASKRDLLLAVGLVVLPLICRGPVISLQSSWMNVQENPAMAAFIQAGIGCGIVLAGFVALFVVVYAWNRSFVLVYELFVLPVTFIAFYTAQASVDLWFLHVLILDATYKVTLFFILMTPFLFPERSRRNPVVPLFASFAVTIGVRALFVGLYSVMTPSAFIGLATVVVLATFIGGGALAFLVIQQQANEREAMERAAAAAAQASLEERCAILARRCDLTPREREILILLAQNYRAPYIAKHLVVSPSTVKTHMRNLYSKLNVHSQAELLLLLDQESNSISTEDPLN